MTTRPAAALAAVRATGRRITSQRHTVLDVIESATQHLDAKGIFQRAKAIDPRISLATVYRTLDVLKHMGLVDQNYIARTHGREHYEPVGAPRHHHFVCLDCQRVMEFQSAAFLRAVARFQTDTGVTVSHVCICLEGYCPRCAAKRERLRK